MRTIDILADWTYDVLIEIMQRHQRQVASMPRHVVLVVVAISASFTPPTATCYFSEQAPLRVLVLGVAFDLPQNLSDASFLGKMDEQKNIFESNTLCPPSLVRLGLAEADHLSDYSTGPVAGSTNQGCPNF